MTIKILENQIIEAIKDSFGIVSTIADRLDVSWHTADRLINSSEATKQAYNDSLERTLDNAESKMKEMIDNNDGQMIRYYLSTKGKKRGFTEKQEIGITDKDGNDRNLNITFIDGITSPDKT